jgi:hypothetical protein
MLFFIDQNGVYSICKRASFFFYLALAMTLKK